MSSEDILNRVITSVPIDATAGRVTSSGQHWEPKRKIANTHFTEPPPLREPNKSELGSSNWQNLKGIKFGRLTVVGIYAKKFNSHGSRWVVRCLCGDYEVRSAKAIRNPLNQKDCCDKCMSLIYLKRSQRLRETGSAPDSQEYM